MFATFLCRQSLVLCNTQDESFPLLAHCRILFGVTPFSVGMMVHRGVVTTIGELSFSNCAGPQSKYEGLVDLVELVIRAWKAESWAILAMTSTLVLSQILLFLAPFGTYAQ